MFYDNIKCPKCGNLTGVQMETHPVDSYFIYRCDECRCFHSGGEELTEQDWSEIDEKRDAYDNNEESW